MMGLRQRITGESGQAAVLFVIFATVITMSAAVVVEGGSLLHERRDMQGVADAAALAGARALPSGEAAAETVATDWVSVKNAGEDAVPMSVVANDDTIDVTVGRDVDSSLLGFFSASDINQVSASAQAMAFSATGVGKALPMALMRDTFSYGAVTEIKTQNPQGPGNHGPVRLEEDPSCSLTSGSNDFRDFILTSDRGGIDSCPTLTGSTIETETGNMSGPSRHGLDGRVDANSDTFADVFEWDAEAEAYKVIKPESPRVGMVPLVENTDGSSDWPNGQADLVIVGYTLVYIGKTDSAGNPTYTNNGKSVWVTPVQGIVPSTFKTELGAFDANADSPRAFRLTQ